MITHLIRIYMYAPDNFQVLGLIHLQDMRKTVFSSFSKYIYLIIEQNLPSVEIPCCSTSAAGPDNSFLEWNQAYLRFYG